jgi:hypothetical protein
LIFAFCSPILFPSSIRERGRGAGLIVQATLTGRRFACRTFPHAMISSNLRDARRTVSALELCYFAEVKIADLHSRHNHLK